MSRHHEEEHEEHVVHDESNWLVSYADMMTLLFGFFVLMYSMSRIDTEKFTVVSQDVAKFFGGKVREDIGVQVVTEDVKKFLATYMKKLENDNSPEHSEELLVGAGNPDVDEFKLTGEKSVEISSKANVMTLKFKGSILFGSGSAQIKPEFAKMLTELGQKLKASGRIQEIKVEGHTDDSPLKSALFPSNWELSAARSSRVIRQFESLGFEPGKLVAEGFGASRPDKPNRSADGQVNRENQALNRRVVIKVEFTQQPSGPDSAASYFEAIKKIKSGPDVQVIDANGKTVTEADTEKEKLKDLPTDPAEVEKKIKEAQAKLDDAKKKAKAEEEETKKRKKLVELQRKLDELNKKTQEVETKTPGAPGAPEATKPGKDAPPAAPGKPGKKPASVDDENGDQW